MIYMKVVLDGIESAFCGIKLTKKWSVCALTAFIWIVKFCHQITYMQVLFLLCIQPPYLSLMTTCPPVFYSLSHRLRLLTKRRCVVNL